MMANQCIYTYKDRMMQDLNSFMTQSPNCELTLAGISIGSQPKKNMLVIRGKIAVKVNEQQKPVGFKFIIPCDYPATAPLLFLDE